MAYNTDELEKQALKAIEKHRLFFIEDVVSYLPCSKPTFYEHKLNELNSIKTALEKNKVDVKVSLRSKWYKSPNATLQMALMKLVCSDDERKKLSMSHTDITSGDKPLATSIEVKITKPLEEDED